MPTTAPRNGTFAALPLGAGLVAAIVLAAIALQGPLTAGPSPDASNSTIDPAQTAIPASPDPASATPMASMEPSPSTAPIGAFTAAFDAYAWTAVDPESGEWVLGRGQKGSQRIALGRGLARADGPYVAFTKDDGERVLVGAVIGDKITEFEVPFDIKSAKARVTPDGTTLFAHAGTQGLDGGIIRIDLTDGKIRTIVAASPVKEDVQRNFLTLSPTGRTLMSTLCDPTECFVDVVDTESGAVRRLSEPFPALLITDRFVFGRLEPGQPWRVWDLDADKSLDVTLDPNLESRALVAVNDSLVVLDSVAKATYRVLALDLDTGGVETIYEGASDVGGAQLMRMAAVAGRWVFLSDAGAISDKLAADGTFPTLQPLGADLGEAPVDAVVLIED